MERGTQTIKETSSEKIQSNFIHKTWGFGVGTDRKEEVAIG